MAIRTDINDFPFNSKDRSVWYFIIDWEQRTELAFCYVQEKRNLLSFLGSIVGNNQTDRYELFGVWNGQYSTDLFKIPIKIGFNELEKYFPSK